MMTAPGRKTAASGRLLTTAQVTALKKQADGKSDYAKHARALLALHAGASQADAARQSGLSAGQVRYWLGKFRTSGLAAFAPAAAKPASGKAAKSKALKNSKEKKAGKKRKKDGKKASKKKSGPGKKSAKEGKKGGKKKKSKKKK